MTAPERRRNLIIGTAGHIDHGKTVLVRALTGRDTDRLAEEKARGISIDLGFAPLELSDGSTVGIVDVPGHENFVRNMMAGATGMDLALLVVAADDGVMPQTREHLAILDLLGVQRAVVAITKIDTVEADLVGLVEDEVEELLADTPLAGSTMVPVSGITMQGIDELRGVIEHEAARVKLKDEALPARLPVDRVFTLRGIGTVVTGTLWSGTVSAAGRLEVLPAGLEARVRNVQVHDLDREEAYAGERVALNVSGAARDKILRGDVLAEPGYLRPTFMVDARFRVLRYWTKPVKRGARIRFHHGTREVLGRMYPLQGAQAAPGDSMPAQIRLEERVVVAPGDRFVIRSYSPVTTIGGGTIVDAHPSKHRLQDPVAVRQFGVLESGDGEARVEVFLERAPGPVTEASLVLSSGLPPRLVRSGLEGLVSSGRAAALGEGSARLYLASALYERAGERVSSSLRDFHAAKPLAEGLAKETLKNRALSSWDGRAADAFLDALVRQGAIEPAGTLVRLPGAGAAVTSEQEALLRGILEKISGGVASPPTLSELAAETGQSRQSVAELLALAEKDGRLVRISAELFFSPEAIAGVEERLREVITPEGITVSDFRKLIGTSRKYALPLLEYFDRTRVTARVGDVRKLR